MELNLLVGGPVSDLPVDFISKIQAIPGDWVGADRGAVRLLKWGIKPVLAVGDFDSANETEVAAVAQACPKAVINPDKVDVTDTELALRYILKEYPQVRKVRIFGATGARLDQFLANLFFVLKPEFAPLINKVEIIDKWNQIQFYTAGEYELEKMAQMQYLAFIPLTAVQELTLKDQKYTLERQDFAYPISLSSNEFVGQTSHFSFKKGVICVVQSHD